MFKNITQLYSLVSTLIYGLLCLMFAGFFMNASTSYFFPEINAAHTVRIHSLDTNADFIANLREKVGENSTFFKAIEAKSYDEITRMREEELKNSILTEEKKNKQLMHAHAKEGMIIKGQWLLLSFIALMIHIVLYRRSAKNL